MKQTIIKIVKICLVIIGCIIPIIGLCLIFYILGQRMERKKYIVQIRPEEQLIDTISESTLENTETQSDTMVVD